jgi:hypothetical protein
MEGFGGESDEKGGEGQRGVGWGVERRRAKEGVKEKRRLVKTLEKKGRGREWVVGEGGERGRKIALKGLGEEERGRKMGRLKVGRGQGEGGHGKG